MKRIRISLITAIVMSLAILLSVSASLASSITCEIPAVFIGGENSNHQIVFSPYGGKINEFLSPGPGPLFTYTATTPGSFKIQDSTAINGAISFDWYLPFDNGLTSIRFQELFGILITAHIFQGWAAEAEKLYFNSASLSGTLVSDFEDTQTAVAPPGFDDIFPFLPGDWSFDAGSMAIFLTGFADITVPITWHENLPEFGGGRWGEASANVPFAGGFTLLGNVAVVPIPSALLLFGSGLLGMASLRRKFSKKIKE